MVRDPKTGQGKGVAFVLFRSQVGAGLPGRRAAGVLHADRAGGTAAGGSGGPAPKVGARTFPGKALHGGTAVGVHAQGLDAGSMPGRRIVGIEPTRRAPRATTGLQQDGVPHPPPHPSRFRLLLVPLSQEASLAALKQHKKGAMVGGRELRLTVAKRGAADGGKGKAAWQQGSASSVPKKGGKKKVNKPVAGKRKAGGKRPAVVARKSSAMRSSAGVKKARH